jgi:acetoin utilization deacetylase AcuC-like enzyme
MAKFGLLADYLREQGILTSKNLFRPGSCRTSWLEQAHCPDYVARFRENRQTATEKRQMNLPWSEGLRDRSLISPAGTVLAAQLALHYGLACHLAGGTHHAHYDHASGFCILNDLAIAARVLLNQAGI